MKTYKQRTQGVLEKVEQKQKTIKKRRKIALSAVGLVACVAFGFWLFMPYSTAMPDLSAYSGSEYYGLMQQLNEMTYTPPVYANNFDQYVATPLKDLFSIKDATGGSAPPAQNGSAGEYRETTDNQVSGVIEGDLIKRSDKYIYYLHDNVAYGETAFSLRVYTIAQENSVLVTEYAVAPENGTKFSGNAEMYLSEDCTQITLVASGHMRTGRSGWLAHTVAVGLDVSDLSNIKETGRTYISGWYNTSRMVDGDLLIINNFSVFNNPDFSDESAFLPQYGSLTNMQNVAMSDIVMPQSPTVATYTVVGKIDQNTLQMQDITAFLSYSGEVYATAERVYITRLYWQETEGKRTEATEISCLQYDGETLDFVGSVSVLGDVISQYCMDEYNGTLRVATSYTERTYYEQPQYGSGYWLDAERNACLYVLDATSFEILASVEKFAPVGEQLRSARFDGNKAYLCTSVEFTDPVFAFDLSNLENITYTDTGTIDGYSTSLVDFGENLLLGIGYGASRTVLKIETYAETDDAVTPLFQYELGNASFSLDYKAYLIDRENMLIGLGVRANGTLTNDKSYFEGYILLGYGDGGFVELAQVPLNGELENMRSVYIDGYLYTFSTASENNFAVRNIAG